MVLGQSEFHRNGPKTAKRLWLNFVVVQRGTTRSPTRSGDLDVDTPRVIVWSGSCHYEALSFIISYVGLSLVRSQKMDSRCLCQLIFRCTQSIVGSFRPRSSVALVDGRV